MPIKPTQWNPADQSANVAIQWDLVTVTSLGSAGFVRSTNSITTGKMYVEMDRSDNRAMFGVASAAAALGTFPGASGQSIGLYIGDVYRGGAVVATSAISLGAIGMAIDATARTVEFRTGTASTGAISIPWSGAIYLAGGHSEGVTSTTRLNAGQSAFTHAVPSGYTAGFGQVLTKSFKGVTRDTADAPAARVVRAMLRSTGELVGEVTSDPTTGEFELWTPYDAYHLLSFHHPDDTQNALVFDWVMPQ